MTKVSVIMPVYNAELFLKRAIDSVLAQTYKDFELICVEDGSKDGSKKILAEYAQKDERIKVIEQENQGASAARNKGLDIASGEYIAFLDADDAMHPQMLEICLSFVSTYRADMISFNYHINDKYTINPKPLDVLKIKKKLVDNPIFCSCRAKKYKLHFNVWSKFFRKKLLENIRFMIGNQFEDVPFVYEVLAQKPRTLFISEKLVFYTANNPRSVTYYEETPKRIKNYHQGIIHIYNVYNHPKLRKEFKFLCRDFLPEILKHQLQRCQLANDDTKPYMYNAFAEELRELKERNMLSWRGHKLKRYLIYRKLLKKGGL